MQIHCKLLSERLTGIGALPPGQENLIDYGSRVEPMHVDQVAQVKQIAHAEEALKDTVPIVHAIGGGRGGSIKLLRVHNHVGVIGDSCPMTQSAHSVVQAVHVDSGCPQLDRNVPVGQDGHPVDVCGKTGQGCKGDRGFYIHVTHTGDSIMNSSGELEDVHQSRRRKTRSMGSSIVRQMME